MVNASMDIVVQVRTKPSCFLWVVIQSTPFAACLRSFGSGMFLFVLVGAAGSSRQGLLRIGTLLSYPQAGFQI